MLLPIISYSFSSGTPQPGCSFRDTFPGGIPRAPPCDARAMPSCVHRSQSSTDWVDRVVIPCTPTRRLASRFAFR